MIRIAIAEDFELIRKSFISLLEKNQFDVIGDYPNGRDLIDAMPTNVPDVVLMDISMPVLNGIETTTWLQENMPSVKVIALSVMNDEMSVLRMLRAGARSYIVKDAEPQELVKAIQQVHENGYYISDMVGSKIFHQLNEGGPIDSDKPEPHTVKEIEIFRHLCTELSYKEIAADMNVSPRTVESWVNNLCIKHGIKSRTGLVLYAIRNRLVIL